MSKKSIYILIVLIVSSLFSCSLSQEINKENKEENSIIEENQALEQEEGTKALTKIEITWIVPELPVDQYILRFGLSQDNLDQTKNIEVGELESIKDNSGRSFYRYELKNVPANQEIFFTLQAKRDGSLSDTTKVFSIKSWENLVKP